MMESSVNPVGSQKITSVFPRSRTVGPYSDGNSSDPPTKTVCIVICLPTSVSNAAASVVRSPTYAPQIRLPAEEDALETELLEELALSEDELDDDEEDELDDELEDDELNKEEELLDDNEEEVLEAEEELLEELDCFVLVMEQITVASIFTDEQVSAVFIHPAGTVSVMVYTPPAGT